MNNIFSSKINKIIKSIFFIVILLFVFCFTSCKNQNNNIISESNNNISESNNNISESNNIISVSILPIKYITESIVGDKWEVNCVIPDGKGHTFYDPSPKDLSLITKSKIYFKTGSIGFEDAMEKKFSNITKSCKFIDISKNIEKIGGHYHDGVYHGGDPHYWLSPKRAIIIASSICENIINIDSVNKNFYINNFKYFKSKMEEVDSVVYNLLSPLKGKYFLVYHPSLTYIADDYKLNQIAIEQDGKEPSAYYMASVIDIAKEQNIKIIFYQKQYLGNSIAKIASEINADTISYNPMAYNLPKSIVDIAQSMNKYIK